MAQTVVRLRGRLTADARIELEGQPDMELGQVEVILRGVLPAPRTQPNDIMSVLARIREQRTALGLVPPTREQVDAEINAMRDEWEERLEELGRIPDEAARARGERSC